ncbi:ribonuclease Z [Paenibacillus sp. UNC499MF]|uniref:ribonuclease Z n=1 Tax=Paenibacillus sp. UNC499MF TaxID=1502751 RepID=UPI0008A08BE4|nr:ribonuclease Z [Paenibacillus sp. UNC499MF]SEG05801.1 ribonuclease Z [Paenibacillus sp. UNC499MF]
MELYFLGTGAGMPARHRNVTSIVLNLLPERGSIWFFDCGEGTQHQILRSPVKLSKSEKLFVTHLHGDHIFGLPGLLSSRSYQGGDTPFTIYGPKGIKAYVDMSLQLSQVHLDYELVIREIPSEGGVVFEDETFRVEAAPLEHRIECFGYRIVEKDLPGKLQQEKLHELGITAGPLYGRLKQGQTVKLEDGRELHGSDFVGPSIKGRTVTILGDTKPCGNSALLAEGADVLVHEATFGAEREDLAEAYDHSTTEQAARTASDGGVGALIMTHISSRYQGEGADRLLEEARAIHPDSWLAEDFYSHVVPRKQS